MTSRKGLNNYVIMNESHYNREVQKHERKYFKAKYQHIGLLLTFLCCFTLI